MAFLALWALMSFVALGGSVLWVTTLLAVLDRVSPIRGDQ